MRVIRTGSDRRAALSEAVRRRGPQTPPPPRPSHERGGERRMRTGRIGRRTPETKSGVFCFFYARGLISRITYVTINAKQKRRANRRSAHGKEPITARFCPCRGAKRGEDARFCMECGRAPPPSRDRPAENAPDRPLRTPFPAILPRKFRYRAARLSRIPVPRNGKSRGVRFRSRPCRSRTGEVIP